jgi:tetratricopeptide (TPR) repeat protein
VGRRSDPKGRPGPLAFSADGRILAFAISDRAISLVDCTTGEALASLEAPERLEPTGLRFSSDGTRLFCAAASGPPAVWDLFTIREALSGLGLDWSQRALKAPPVMETANPARLIFDNGRMERAQQDLQLLQQLAESSPPSNVASNWAKRGWLNTGLGWHNAAVQDYTRALEMEVRADWYYSRGLSHAWLHQHSEAIADLERAMNLAPDYPEGCAELAFIRFYCPDPRYRDESAGRRLVEESLRLAPTNPITQLWMALAEHRAGHDAESLRILEGDNPGETGNLVRAWLLVQAMSRARAHDLRGARQSFDLGRRMLVEEPTLRAFYFNNRIFYRAFLDEAAQAIAEEESRAQSTAANKP